METKPKTTTRKKSSSATSKEVAPTPVNVAPRLKYDKDDEIDVFNGFAGKLIFRTQSGRLYNWNNFGDVQTLTIGELREAASTQTRFFEQNWFIIDDVNVLDYLRVTKYYKDALSLDEFESLFRLDIDDMVAKLKKLSAGQRNSVVYRAQKLIIDGDLDSNKRISALEEELETTFER